MSFFVTIRGNGSYGIAPGPTWRGPATFEISAAEAEAILQELEAGRVGDWVVVSTVKPEVEESGKPDWMLRPEDFASNRRAAELTDFDAASPDSDYVPEDGEFECPHCGKCFTSDPGLAQHTALNHSNIYEQMQEEVREALEAERQRKAIIERVREADPKTIRPEERGPD